MTDPRRREASGSPHPRSRLGIAALLVVLLFFALILLSPLSPGAVRVAGVALAWWYGGLLAPLLAVLITVACLGVSHSGHRD